MREEQKKILKEFAGKVREVYPHARIWAFGSYARDTAIRESDLDICVVIPRLQPDDRLAVSDMAWEIGFNHDLHLSTVVVSEDDFERGPVSSSPLLEAVRSEGIAA
jgi:DNA polymerase sigma